MGDTKVRSKVESILLSKKEDKKQLNYIAFDGRNDATLFPKNQTKRKEHITFIGKQYFVT